MFESVETIEAFSKSCQAYSAWLDCGKDLVNHADLFDVYDKSVDDFAHSLYPTFSPNTRQQRDKAFFAVWNAVTMGGIIK